MTSAFRAGVFTGGHRVRLARHEGVPALPRTRAGRASCPRRAPTRAQHALRGLRGLGCCYAGGLTRDCTLRNIGGRKPQVCSAVRPILAGRSIRGSRVAGGTLSVGRIGGFRQPWDQAIHRRPRRAPARRRNRRADCRTSGGRLQGCPRGVSDPGWPRPPTRPLSLDLWHFIAESPSGAGDAELAGADGASATALRPRPRRITQVWRFSIARYSTCNASS